MARPATGIAAFIFAGLSFAVPAHAQTVYKNGYQPAPDAYTNLPGVKDPRTLQQKERYTCSSTSVTSSYPDGAYRDVFGSRGLPVQGYRCTGSAGVTATGTRVPTSKDWYPGINPPAVDF
ncbi:hypothetical protein G6L37_08530 [Agrobacterium rubi]|uniref:Uncharacterized protein n=1 Tax=Agrobacterium rubi TR3 = NBRC 13261 TaxID=1368415 RepID=A0A081CUY6_9HYPH|nr:hypothetical protein [Agrobacterium rubi]MBP1879338.1 hypothetical protein [Agrobacterium rubi]MCL6653455.1 hypothetical protein [Agrobacterium rubi]NTF06208.1 hypothetical protein [Agrobacterium rubi]NTF18449.1 hypothetical protein [Agrobacterium rubi]NTF25413.1 hypothetical protein [Agrobacterium rubi]